MKHGLTWVCRWSVYASPSLLRRSGRCENFPLHLLSTTAELITPPSARSHQSGSPSPSPVTFDYVAVDSGSELLASLLVEVLAVDDPHLFEESRLAALARAKQQYFHQPLHVGLLPGEASIDLLGAPQLLHLAAVEQAYGQANF